MNEESKFFPASKDAEEWVIGCAMLDRDSISIALELNPDDFWYETNRELFTAIAHLYRTTGRCETAAVKLHIQSTGRQAKFRNMNDEEGSFALYDAILAAMERVTSTSAMRHHVDIVKGLARRRLLERAIHDGGRAIASSPVEDDEAIVSTLIRKLLEITGNVSKVREMLGPLVARTLDGLLNAAAVPQTPRIQFGIPELDRVLAGGVAQQRLALIAARPGEGKTSLALTLLRAAAKDGRRGIFFSLENTVEDTALHALASEGQVSTSNIASRDLKELEVKRLRYAAEVLNCSTIQIDDRSRLSVASIRGEAKRFAMEHGDPEFVIVDHLSLMEFERGENQNLRVGNTSRALKLLAKELNCAMVVLCQMSRAIESRDSPRPKLSDLRDSGSLEQDADQVIFCWTPERPTWKKPAQNSTLVVAKNRGLATGDVDCEFAANLMLFRNRPTQSGGEAAY